MADNPSLVPAQSSPGFAQQGSVDWVAVARTPVAFTLDVLARYSKAGVDPFTLGVAQAVCSGFDLKPAAQKRLEESVSKLQKFPSFGKLVWFGFGLKHVIDDLLETEQGAACVALAGCLTASYDTGFVSQVFRSMCQINNAPKSLTPSVRQWHTLVSVGAGCLANSQFPNLLIGFERLLTEHLQDSACRTPPESETLAGAIIILGNLSRGKLQGATFTGGLDCAWIAAMAEWMLCLGVEINDSSGNTLYRSQSLSSSEYAHVTINIEGKSPSRSSALTHKTFCIPSGRDLIHDSIGSFSNFQISSAVRMSVPWAGILTATFGEKTMQSLVQVPKNAFAAIIVSTLFPLIKVISEHNTIYNGFNESNYSRRETELVEWINWRLPELRPCFEESISYLSQAADMNCWRLICETCDCASCHEYDHSQGVQREYCLFIVTGTIIRYLNLLSKTSIDSLILPSRNGLRLLYRKTTHASDKFYENDFALVQILEYLTGQSSNEWRGQNPEMTALSANGICVFYDIFSDLNVSPLQIGTIRIVLGHIEFEGVQKHFAYDIYNEMTGHGGLEIDDKDILFNMIVHQEIYNTDIMVGYQMSVRREVVGSSGLDSILHTVKGRITYFDCTTWCQPRNLQPENDSLRPKVRFDNKSVDVQWLGVLLTWEDAPSDDDTPSHDDTEPPADGCHFTLDAVRCCYSRLYLDILDTFPDERSTLVRINNCSKCLLMFASEALFGLKSRDPSRRWGLNGTVTIRRPGAEVVELKLRRGDLNLRKMDDEMYEDWFEGTKRVGPVPLYPDVPLEHDPIF